MSKEVVNIVCCLWGDWPVPGWGPEYVARLQRAVHRNLTVPHRFICFVDDPKRMSIHPIDEVRPLKAPVWDGCLPKLYVYSPDAGLEGRTILIDLDDVITGTLDPLALYDGDYAVRAWFAGYERGQRVPDGDIISFRPGSFEARILWNRFIEDPKGAVDWTGGRERYFIRDTVKPDLWQDVLGARYMLSYKRHCKGQPPGPNTSIVCFHDAHANEQRPHQMQEKLPWVAEAWR